MARLSKFRSDDARAAYLRLYDAALSASPAQVTESDVETSCGSTHVLHAGDRSKPSLVALHGSSISSTSWVPLLPVLTATHYVTMIDAIDEAGKSVAARPTTKVADITTWLDETLRAIDVQRSSFVAASRGTWIAAHYFKMSFRNAQPRPWPFRSDCDLDRLMAIPVLAVIGRDESALNGPKSASMLRESLPDARIEVVDDANHMVMVDQAATVERLLVEFLGDVY
ncbi:MAG: alpha/beta hydrolase fold protein [Mycobacterium sp.]|nr:alpha/beta hydrolase fold protein [Mycobacterium sp.]